MPTFVNSEVILKCKLSVNEVPWKHQAKLLDFERWFLPQRLGKADKNGPLLRTAPDTHWPVSVSGCLCNCDFSFRLGHKGGTQQGKRINRKTPRQHVVAQVSTPIPLPQGGFSRSLSGWKREGRQGPQD